MSIRRSTRVVCGGPHPLRKEYSRSTCVSTIVALSARRRASRRMSVEKPPKSGTTEVDGTDPTGFWSVNSLMPVAISMGPAGRRRSGPPPETADVDHLVVPERPRGR